MITEKLKTNVRRYLVTCSEDANHNYNTDFIRRLFAEEGKNHFTVRSAVLGHTQEGGAPSPFDRNFGESVTFRSISLCSILIRDCLFFSHQDGSSGR